MALLRDFRRHGRQIAASLLGVAVVAYFGYHALEGERGLRSYFGFKHRIEAARMTLAGLDSERAALEVRVRALRPERLDLDMLEERAHQVLGLVHEDEVVVLLNRSAH